jgi:hypothetical protein
VKLLPPPHPFIVARIIILITDISITDIVSVAPNSLLKPTFLTWICLIAGVYSVKRDVISRTVFNLRDVTSRPMFATDTCMMYYVARIELSEKQNNAVLYRITLQSGIDHDLVSDVKILLKAFF